MTFACHVQSRQYAQVKVFKLNLLFEIWPFNSFVTIFISSSSEVNIKSDLWILIALVLGVILRISAVLFTVNYLADWYYNCIGSLQK